MPKLFNKYLVLYPKVYDKNVKMNFKNIFSNLDVMGCKLGNICVSLTFCN